MRSPTDPRVAPGPYATITLTDDVCAISAAERQQRVRREAGAGAQ
jgi:K+/H+ antiporter YhaU regulatory subunit KhtT